MHLPSTVPRMRVATTSLLGGDTPSPCAPSCTLCPVHWQADQVVTVTHVYKHLMDTIPGFDMSEAAVGTAMHRGVEAGWLVQEGEPEGDGHDGATVYHLKAPVQTPDRAMNTE